LIHHNNSHQYPICLINYQVDDLLKLLSCLDVRPFQNSFYPIYHGSV
jgi:hypothetical protein